MTAHINKILAAIVLILTNGQGHSQPYSFFIDTDNLNGAPVSKLNTALGDDDVVYSKGGHFYTIGANRVADEDDERVKFWGVNLVPPLVFPRTPEEAQRLASRFRKYGFNMVRIIGVDRAVKKKYKSLIRPDGSSYPEIDEKNYQYMKYLLDALGDNGIYTTLIIKSGYKFPGTSDCPIERKNYCVPDVSRITKNHSKEAKMPNGSRPLDLFNQEMISAQKAFARNLFEDIKDHPSLALIEINNENSLLEHILRRQTALPPLYALELDRLWTDWLLSKYSSFDKIRSSLGYKVYPNEISTSSHQKFLYIRPAGKGSSEIYKDYLLFLAELEYKYYEDMRSFIRDDLGINRPVTGTQANYGGLITQYYQSKIMDYLDLHYYWDHPRIPPFKQHDWVMENIPMSQYPERSIATEIPTVRVKGLPLTISEYSANHANSYADQAYIIAAAYASLHDIDGVFIFNYYSSGGDIRNKLSPKRLAQWYNLVPDTRVEAIMSSLANIFRRGDVMPSRTATDIIIDSDARIDTVLKGYPLRYIRKTLSDRKYINDSKGKGYDAKEALYHRVNLVHDPDSVKSHNIDNFINSNDRIIVSDTEELRWVRNGKKSKVIVDSAKTKAITGYLGEVTQFDGVEVRDASSPNEQGSIIITSLDDTVLGESKNILVTMVSGGANNATSMIKDGKRYRRCVIDSESRCEKPFWDKTAGEFEVNTVSANIAVTTVYKYAIVETLDELGESVASRVIKNNSGRLLLNLGKQGGRSPWHKITMVDAIN